MRHFFILILALITGCAHMGAWDDTRDEIVADNQYRIVHFAGSEVIRANCPGWDYDSQLGCRSTLPDGRAVIWSLAAWMPTEHGLRWYPYSLAHYMDLLTGNDGGPYVMTEYVRRDNAK